MLGLSIHRFVEDGGHPEQGRLDGTPRINRVRSQRVPDIVWHLHAHDGEPSGVALKPRQERRLHLGLPEHVRYLGVPLRGPKSLPAFPSEEVTFGVGDPDSWERVDCGKVDRSEELFVMRECAVRPIQTSLVPLDLMTH